MIHLDTILTAVAARLDEAGVGEWPGPTGTYTGRRPPVYAKRLQADPGEAIAVNVYQVEDDPDPDGHVTRAWVQVRCRAPMTADLLADWARETLHGRHNTTWGEGVRVARCTHESTAQLGADPASGLDERTDNYRLEILT